MEDIPKRIPTTTTDRVMGFLDCVIDLMIQLELEFTETLDVGRLSKAIDFTLDAEPVLGCRLVSKWRRPYWERLDKDVRDAFFFTEDRAEYEAFKNASIDTYQGPQIKACLYRSSIEDRLLLKMTHDVADAGGVKETAGVISSIYSRLAGEPAYRPEPNLSGSRNLRQVMRHIPWHAYPRIYLNHIQTLLSQIQLQRNHTLPLGDGPRTPFIFVHRIISQDQVARLSQYGRAHHATLNDLMIAAFFRALAVETDLDPKAHFKLTTTVDLRRWYLPSGRGEAIANLSALEYQNLRTDLGVDFSSTLERVAANTKRRKASWLGLSDWVGGIPLFLLPNDWGKGLYRKILQSAIDKRCGPPIMTNMGPISTECVTFDTPPRNAWLLPPPAYPPWFLCGLAGYEGTLSLSAGVYPYQRDIVEQFFDQILSQLPV